MFSRVLPILVTGAFLTGCATNPGPKPDDQLASAQSALQSAANAGGEDTEPSMVAAAREKVATAESLITEERYGEARRLLEQAEVDARLAEARAETQKVRDELGDVRASIDSLRRNLENQN
ncbi:protein of unknown function [Marinobacter segnicrescens]|uniref:DUF4398 domain-containing protein n=1 Tax=Marinobacter segnicrescens TaxID=430453 RepID=A0A1I0HS18_9GAMM|nr:DUF4398 domain-containing protein [Marinobacter segnicrescens]SET85972.1 protein of unknown function [Marinobacter segnicrescens]